MNIKAYRVKPNPTKFDLAQFDADDQSLVNGDKEAAKAVLAGLRQRLESLQSLFYANGAHKLLIVLQAMDTAGKDSTIRMVFDGVNPQGVRIANFKAPTAEELAHDFLWRIHSHAPAKGTIRIFNRSQYEDVLITRVHGWCDDETAVKRMKAINDFEELLLKHNNTQVLKFYLHISQEEQQQRLQQRTHELRKMWKYNEKDFEEARLWKKYMSYYEDCFNTCNKVPWHIIPSDQNWYKEYLIASVVYDTLKKLKMQYPGLKK